MTNKESIKWLDALLASDKRKPILRSVEVCAIKRAIEVLQQLFMPNLDEATKEYTKVTSEKVWGKINPKRDFNAYIGRAKYEMGLSDGFKGGAEWIDKQGETFNEVPVSVSCDDKKEISMKLDVEGTSLESLKNGEKVTVIIRRNNE